MIMLGIIITMATASLLYKKHWGYINTKIYDDVGKLVFLVILFIAFTHLSDGAAECSSQDVADSVERKLHKYTSQLNQKPSTSWWATGTSLILPASSSTSSKSWQSMASDSNQHHKQQWPTTEPVLLSKLSLVSDLITLWTRYFVSWTDLHRQQWLLSIFPATLMWLDQNTVSQQPLWLLHNNWWYRTRSSCLLSDGTGLWHSSGWTRVAYLNMSDPTEECPSGFRLYNQNGVRACGRPVTSGGSCLSVRFPSYSISYSQACGRVYGYQKGSPWCFLGAKSS